MAKRNLKLTPEVKLPAVIQPRRPLPTPETDGKPAEGKTQAVKLVYVEAVKLGDFASLGSALLARFSPLGCIYYLHLDGRSSISIDVV